MEQIPKPQEETPDIVQQDTSEENKTTSKKWIFITAGILLLAAFVAVTVALINSSPEKTGMVRDIFIIFLVFESLVIGVALVILITQIAVLINLIQNQIKPILDATNETANTLKGTTKFISNNLVEPVIKLNEYLAVFKEVGNIFHFRKK